MFWDWAAKVLATVYSTDPYMLVATAIIIGFMVWGFAELHFKGRIDTLERDLKSIDQSYEAKYSGEIQALKAHNTWQKDQIDDGLRQVQKANTQLQEHISRTNEAGAEMRALAADITAKLSELQRLVNKLRGEGPADLAAHIVGKVFLGRKK